MFSFSKSYYEPRISDKCNEIKSFVHETLQICNINIHRCQDDGNYELYQ